MRRQTVIFPLSDYNYLLLSPVEMSDGRTWGDRRSLSEEASSAPALSSPFII